MPLKINLTEDRLRTLDKSGMLGKTLDLPQQMVHGLELGQEFIRTHDLPMIPELDWCGLGGSAVAGDLLQGFGFEQPEFPLRIHVQRYSKPSAAPRLVSSYSGNTVESVYALSSASPDQIWLTMSSGGTLEGVARSIGVPHLRIPGGLPPRAAVGYGLGAMMAILDVLFDLRRMDEYRAACKILTSDAESYRVLDAEKNPALALAVQLIDKTPVIYTLDDAMPAQAIRFRAQLAENAKVWSHSAPLPEMAHNEVESFPVLGQVLPPPLVVFLGSWKFQGLFTDPRLGMTKILDSYRISHIALDPAQLWPDHPSRLASGLRLMLLLDAATVYLALLRAVDPTEIPTITELKNFSPTA